MPHKSLKRENIAGEVDERSSKRIVEGEPPSEVETLPCKTRKRKNHAGNVVVRSSRRVAVEKPPSDTLLCAIPGNVTEVTSCLAPNAAETRPTSTVGGSLTEQALQAPLIVNVSAQPPQNPLAQMITAQPPQTPPAETIDAQPPLTLPAQIIVAQTPQTPLAKTTDNSATVPQSPATSIAAIMSGHSISFSDAMAKLTGRPVESSGKVDLSQKEMVFLEDTSRRIVSSLPMECAVTDPSLQDDLLKQDYTGLPPLFCGQLKSWSDREGISTTRFSGWLETCPKVNFQRAMNAVQFVLDGRYVNPSRVAPTLLSARDTSANNSRYIAEVKVADRWETAVFLTPVCVIQSHLHDHSRDYNYITGVAHGQEWECMVAVFCMIMNETVLNAQVVGSELQFSSKPTIRSTASFKTQPGTSSVMVNSTPSPASVCMMKTKSYMSKRDTPLDGKSSGFVRSVLESTDIIPVFDARDYSLPLELSANELSQLEKTLPLFLGEIPEGSMAIIAYTVTYYYKDMDRSWNLSTNLQWVVVLGTPNMS